MNPPYEEFALLEHTGWQRVANRYEDAWSGLTRQFIPHLLQVAEVTSGTVVLDVACGPGYVAKAALALGAVPTGVDFSAGMIRLARERNPAIKFLEGDAQALEFADKHFDVVLMNFGLLHLPDPRAAFAEAFRVLRSGGCYGFTVWAGPEQSPGGRIVEEAVKAHADMTVPLPKGPDYFGYSNPDECRKTLGSAGFDPASLDFQTVTVEWSVPTASFLFEAERDAGVRTAALLAQQTPSVLKAIQTQIEESVKLYRKGNDFVIPFAAHLITVKAS
jgi:SAM-dependent methyltransferase